MLPDMVMVLFPNAAVLLADIVTKEKEFEPALTWTGVGLKVIEVPEPAPLDVRETLADVPNGPVPESVAKKVADEPCGTQILLGGPEMVKSKTARKTFVLPVVDPLVPVTVMEKDPLLAEHVRVELAALPKVTLAGLREHVTPVLDDQVRLTVPVKPPVLVTVIVNVPVPPGVIVAEDGVDDKAKPFTTRFSTNMLDSAPVFPVTVTV